MITLNKGQEAAKNALLDFLSTDDQKFFCFMGPAGTGKTTVLRELEGDLKFFNQQRKMFNLTPFGSLVYCATTNKASSLFGNASTIHKVLGLRPQTDYKNGNKYLVKSPNSKNQSNSIIIIDEASMVNKGLHKHIDDLTVGSKVIYLLDPQQLPPIGYATAYVSDQGYPEITLTQPMRQDVNSHLYKMCCRLREGVINTKYLPFEKGTGIEFVEGNIFTADLVNAFKNGENARVLCYSNTQVEQFNKFIRKQLHDCVDFRVGDLVVAANTPKESGIKIEETYKITLISDEIIDYMGLPCKQIHINGNWFKIPVDKNKYFSMVKLFQKEAKSTGNWYDYYELKEGVLDIRDAFACTVHASQGSTYDTVYVDFENMCKCRDLNTFLRLLYVAVSRAKQKVVVYGL